ncbi:hypothetical protein KEM56_001745 [Ascosphaera pollenicola]|nr:hypothetical protein KEM56_001745 [Ascosphaera pollenicola]
MSGKQGIGSLADSDGRHASGTRWQILSSEDIGAPIDQEIIIPETPPKEASDITDEEEDEGLRCVRRRQAEYHHRPPVWRVEVLDEPSVEAGEDGASSQATGIQLTPEEFAGWATSYDCDPDAPSLSEEALQSRMTMPQSQPRSDNLRFPKAPPEIPASGSVTINGRKSSLQAHERSHSHQSTENRKVSYLRNIWTCATAHNFAELTPGTRVIYVGDVEFPGKERHRFGELWVLYRTLNDTLANCIRLEHDLDKEHGFDSKVFTVKPLNYPVRMLSANIPLAAMTQERHFANYFAYMQQRQGTIESVIMGERLYVQTNHEQSHAFDKLKGREISRRMLAALFMDVSFRMESSGGFPVNKASMPQSTEESDITTHKLAREPSMGAIDATSYLLTTPDCRLCDPSEADNGKEKQKRSHLKDTLRRRKSNKNVRHKVKSLFGSQNTNASSPKIN